MMELLPEVSQSQRQHEHCRNRSRKSRRTKSGCGRSVAVASTFLRVRVSPTQLLFLIAPVLVLILMASSVNAIWKVNAVDFAAAAKDTFKGPGHARDGNGPDHENGSGGTSSGSRSRWSWDSITNGMADFACFLVRSECCRSPYLRRNDAAGILRKRLKAEFFGQHLAQETVITALDAHLQDANPGKALVMSFHGWAGSGKTYLAELLIESLYQKGMNSNYYKFYLASLHFPDESKVKEYQEELRTDIKRVLRSCPYGVFVFDEVDKTPPGVFDAIVPFIEYPGTIENTLDHKRAIFIFLSNTGSNEITAITMAGWKAGKRREELNFRDYEERLLKEAFNNAENGLFRSRLIDRVLVDYFIPFLPMERKHILQCIDAELKRHGKNTAVATTEGGGSFADIADTLTYWPADIKLYSITGCKRVEAAVKYQIMREKHLNEEDANANGGSHADSKSKAAGENPEVKEEL